MGLKVVDLYCGAGGFSEGFRQMGFEVVAGVDNWSEARTSFRKNQSGAWVPDKYSDIPRFRKDIARLIREKIGEVDVVIGGPPCVEYSSSKNGGSGDVKSGLRQVNAFFEIVKDLEPEYWIMENVPRIESYMEDAIGDGHLDPPGGRKKWVFDSQYHRVPQARRRLFTGSFPGETVNAWAERRKKTGQILPLKAVVGRYPSCSRKSCGRKVTDPLYDHLTREETLISDHFGYGRHLKLSGLEIQMNIDLKKHHRQYGRMSFPENPNRPSRTIMATQFSVSRESVVVRDSREKGVLRRLTPRECASLQGYPMTYQFWGLSAVAKYRLIGNSVPVGLSRDIARSILLDKGMRVPVRPLLQRADPEQAPPTPMSSKKVHLLHDRYQWHPVRSMVRGCRVDLDNTQRYAKDSSAFPVIKSLGHEYRWDAVLHVGIGRPRWVFEQVEPDAIIQSVIEIELAPRKSQSLLKKIRKLHGAVPDATTLAWAHQHPNMNDWRHSTDGVPRPRYLLDLVDNIRLKSVGNLGTMVDCRDHISICPERGLPSDVVVTAFILYWMCREINSCTGWISANNDKRHRSPSASARPICGGCLGVLSKDFPTSLV